MRKPISGKVWALLMVSAVVVFPLLVVFSIAAFIMFIARYIIAFTLCLFDGKSLSEAHHWVMDDVEATDEGAKQGGL